MKTSISLLLIAGFLQLTSCKYTCEEFPESELRWVPFETEDRLQYSNGEDTLNFEVVDNYLNGETSDRGIWMDVECPYVAYYLTNKVNDYLITEHYGYDYTGKFLASISESDEFYFFLAQTNIEDASLTTIYANSKTINNIAYSEVYTIYKDTLGSNPRISWIIKAAEYGIVQFHDRSVKQTWTKLK